ncbi:MAG: hypothetical protein AAF318_13280 [Pseudomonadota bacterium]
MRALAIFGHSTTPRADMGLAVVVGAFAALLFWKADKFPPLFFDPLGSAAVPEGRCGAPGRFGGHLFSARRGVGVCGPLSRVQARRARPDIAIGIAWAAILTVAAMEFEILGFRTASIAFVIVASALLGRFSPTVMLVGAVVAVLVGFGGAYLSTRVFLIALPLEYPSLVKRILAPMGGRRAGGRWRG